MTAKEIINWIIAHPEEATHDLTRVCNDGNFKFEFARTCEECPYHINKDKWCNEAKIAEDLRMGTFGQTKCDKV